MLMDYPDTIVFHVKHINFIKKYKQIYGVLGRPRGSRWRGRWEGGLGWGIHVKPWLILVNV